MMLTSLVADDEQKEYLHTNTTYSNPFCSSSTYNHLVKNDGETNIKWT